MQLLFGLELRVRLADYLRVLLNCILGETEKPYVIKDWNSILSEELFQQ